MTDTVRVRCHLHPDADSAGATDSQARSYCLCALRRTPPSSKMSLCPASKRFVADSKVGFRTSRQYSRASKSNKTRWALELDLVNPSAGGSLIGHVATLHLAAQTRSKSERLVCVLPPKLRALPSPNDSCIMGCHEHRQGPISHWRRPRVPFESAS